MSLQPNEFRLKDVRCFDGTQTALLRPITLLIGENSTGKSTFLGCYSVIHRMFNLSGLHYQYADFNEPPFPMGSFRDIIRNQRRNTPRLEEFQLGLGFETNKRGTKRIDVKFREIDAQPSIKYLRCKQDDLFLEFERLQNNRTQLSTPKSKLEVSGNIDYLLLEFFVLGIPISMRAENKDPEMEQYIEHFGRKWRGGKRSQRRTLESAHVQDVTALAPLRARPRRTYDPIREPSTPEGDHVPMLMMRLALSNREHWNKLHKTLVKFGKQSDLFTDIRIKSHGRQMSDPFQIQVKARSGTFGNIMDVGYGVSQSLPILVDIMGETNTLFILQQPEVHLHPRCQAELASFLIESAVDDNNRFFIETHSDYVVDRVRISVRKGILSASDVSLLYFRPDQHRVTVENIVLDDEGNLCDVPQGYREFFMRELDVLLGIND